MTVADLYHRRLIEGAITRDPAQEYAAQQLDDFIFHLKTPQKTGLIRRLKREKAAPTRGIYLYGGVGRGKTMLMDMLVASMNSARVRRVHFHAFMLEIHARLKQQRDRSVEEDFIGHVAADIARDIDVLCFDEIHVNDIADAMILGPLFGALMDKGVAIVATSNYHPGDLYKDGLQRARFLPFIERIKAHMHIVHLDSPTDYRLRALSERGTWFHPLGDRSWGAMNALFEALTDNKKTPSATLDIDGRSLPILRADARSAWLAFDVLCRENRGASDYLALGHAFEAIFVDGVPRLSEETRNEARRFMTLVDTLYDLGRVLVVTAAASPQQLYDGSSHGFEFQRTVSRLIEMQSPEYLARHGLHATE